MPNPQDALPLPPRPSLEHYRKRAKKLVKDGTAPTLTAAQFSTARSHGFESWPKFAKHLEALAQKSPVSRFEAAADAIADGNIATLTRLLSEDPKLVRARSTREHRATLLHYVAANGVENFRQRTPANIVEITNMLLDAGAQVEATADVYGGGYTTLGLAATSVHPERAGVQQTLLQTLLDHGAESSPSLVVACLANGRGKAAEFLAGRETQLDLPGAAGVGRLDLVKALVDEAPADQGLLFACAYGRNDVVEFLLAKGADLAAHRSDGQTPLHTAVIGGHLETVKLLLRYQPPLEAVNIYGGTVWGQALWSAAHGGDPELYIAILEALAAAGAKIGERHVPVNAQVDAWLAAHGSVAEPPRVPRPQS